MKKRLMTVFLCLCLVFTLFPATSFASGEDSNRIFSDGSGLCEHHAQHDESCGYTEGTAEIPCSHEHNESCGGLTDPAACTHTHDEACGYVPATEGTPCTYVCEICNAQDSRDAATPSDVQPEGCTCETLCTEEEVNADCPACSAEGAELDKVCVGAAPMLPVMARAVESAPAELYVGNHQINTNTSTISYLKAGSTEGSLAEGTSTDWTVRYDPATATLTLHGATIQRGTNGISAPFGSGIYAMSGSGQSLSLTIELIGTNRIEGNYGIYLNASQTQNFGTDASLTIKKNGENGSLTVTGTDNYGIHILSGTGNASLGIENAAVTSSSNSSYPSAGVCVQSGSGTTSSPALSLAVNGGSLTASGTGGSDGIRFSVGSSQATGATTSLTVTNNAIVDARTGGIKARDIKQLNIGAGSTGNAGGIVWNGSNGTVYGNVELQEDLKIGEGESLADGEVGTSYTAELKADGDTPVAWSISSGSLPASVSLSEDGKISGIPTAEGTSTFTVTATNDIGSDSKDFTLKIEKPASISVTGLELDKYSLILQEKDSDTLTATVKPDNATNKNVTWESSDSSIATVDYTGKVTAVAPGTVTIKVTTADGGKTAACKVTVTARTYGISANPETLDFGSVYTGYTQPAAQTVTITNTGNQSVTFDLPTSTDYVITAGTGFSSSTATLSPTGEATFTVKPTIGLSVGDYAETLTISGSNSISARVELAFKVDPKQYLVTVNGSYAQATGAGSYAKDAAVTIDAGTRSGYTFAGWTSGDGVTFANAGSAQTTFTMPEKAVTVTANWTRNPSYDYYIITASAGTGGSISPSGSISVREGLDKTFTIIPDSGWRISDVLVDGKSVGAATSYTFDNVQKKHTIEAVFETINGIIIEEDGTIILPGEDLESTADDIRIEKGNGTENPIYVSDTESVIIKEGNQVILPSGNVVECEAGSQVSIDGTITEPDGTVITSDGVTHRTDGAEVAYDGTVLKAAVPVVRTVEVSGNTPKVILNDQAYGAQGYDFVISSNKNCIVDKDYYQVSKDVSEAETDFVYVQKGIYYAYCHSWIKGADGKKIFSSWSEPYKFEVADTTPETPVIQSIRKNANGTITVTTVKGGPSYGYDIIFGTSLKKVNGEIRPVDYGNYVAKNRRKKTLTFPKLKPGTYYIAAHAFNVGENNQKVFSPWSNIRKIVIK